MNKASSGNILLQGFYPPHDREKNVFFNYWDIYIVLS